MQLHLLCTGVCDYVAEMATFTFVSSVGKKKFILIAEEELNKRS